MKSGYLTKSPPDNKTPFHGWKKRYFILVDTRCVYPNAPRDIRIEYYTNFEESKSGNPLGLIDLNCCSGVLNREQMKGHKQVFDIVTPTRVFHLSADTLEERKQWVEVLNTSIFSHHKQIYRFDPHRRSSDFTPDTEKDPDLLTSLSRDGNIIRVKGGPRAQSLRSTKSASIEPYSSYPDMFVPNYTPANPIHTPNNPRLLSSREEVNDTVFGDSVCDKEILSEKGFTAVPFSHQDIHMSLPIQNESPYMNVSYASQVKSADVSPTGPMMPSPYKKIPQSASAYNFQIQKLSTEAPPAPVSPPSRAPVLEEYAKVHRIK